MPPLALAPPIEVLLVDDQRSILAGVAALIESEIPFMRIVGQAVSGRQALDLACSIQPDVIVLDVDLGGEDGLELIPLFRNCCDASIIVFTSFAVPEVQYCALHLGACAFVSKAASGDALVEAIRRACAETGK